ncbi:MAG: S26 family signal peptidase [Candidatus Omnitrophica bacterium]|nr:S26 family signal peptidase [Candidatus Omnitrophota bacterium]
MAPVLKAGELVVVEEGAYASAAPRRGDVVAARPAALGGRACVKRVAGLPHERVRVGEREWRLEEGQFFLLGDRAEDSLDSRAFGPVPREELLGPVRKIGTGSIFHRIRLLATMMRGRDSGAAARGRAASPLCNESGPGM